MLADEEILGKAYDSKLMKRLLTYAKPHMGKLIIALLLLVVITLGDLAGPYLLKIIVDDHLDASNNPFIPVPIEEVPEYQGEGIEGRAFVHGRGQSEDNYYLIQQKGTAFLVLIKVSGTYKIEDGLLQYKGTSYPVIKVPKSELKAMRVGDYQAVVNLSLFYLFLMMGLAILGYLQSYLLNYTGQSIIFSIRQQVFEHLQYLDIAFFDQNYVGRLVTRATNDVENLNEMYTDILVNTLRDILTLVGIVVIMLKMDLKLSLIAFSVVPLIALSAILFRRIIRQAYREVRRHLSELNGFLSESISGMRIIQIFNQEKKKNAEFQKINGNYRQATLKEITVYAIFRPVMELIYYVALSLIIYLGGKYVLGATIQFGLLFAFVNYVQRFFGPINSLTEKFNIMQSAMASSERIFQLLDTKPSITNPELPIIPQKREGLIEFKNVTFAYKDDNYVLKNISFVAKPGETVAFVGHTGAGKTSIINLVNRFYDIQKGQILIDGIDVKDWDLEALRKRIGIVLQDVFLFSGDIKSNIKLNNQEITLAKVQAACRAVSADSFILRLPRAYDEKVTERGSTLSAGQRQLLAFARALAFDPDILILDEATANIDTETEQLIQAALKEVTQNRTTLVIAHRLSTIQHANKIIVLHKGEIVEMGNRQELLDKGGLYYRLYQLQYQANEKLASSN